MVQFSAVIPKEPHQPESEAQLYKFMYTVKQEEKQKAIDFCNTIITHIYKGWNDKKRKKKKLPFIPFFFLIDIVFEKRLKILINPFSGQAKAKQIFESHVRPIFEASKCKCDIQCKV
jgi:sphingosine kinase